MDKKDNIRIDGRVGTWYVIEKRYCFQRNENLYLLEHETYGDMAMNLIVNENLEELHECYGWDSYEEEELYKMEIEDGMIKLFEDNGLDAIVFFDTETTGLYYKADQIIEVSAQRLIYDKKNSGLLYVDKRLKELVKLSEGRSISSFIESLTGINDDMLAKGGITETELITKLNEIIEGKVLVVAHNAQFDLMFIHNTWLRSDVPFCRLFEDNVNYLDTLTVFKDRRDYGHRLEEAVEFYDIQLEGYHRAENDTTALIAITAAMQKEKQDLSEYVNLFGIHAKYGMYGAEIEGIKYIKQEFASEKPLYELLENKKSGKKM